MSVLEKSQDIKNYYGKKMSQVIKDICFCLDIDIKFFSAQLAHRLKFSTRNERDPVTIEKYLNSIGIPEIYLHQKFEAFFCSTRSY